MRAIKYLIDDYEYVIHYHREDEKQFFIVLGGIEISNFKGDIRGEVQRLVEEDYASNQIEAAELRKADR